MFFIHNPMSCLTWELKASFSLSITSLGSSEIQVCRESQNPVNSLHDDPDANIMTSLVVERILNSLAGLQSPVFGALQQSLHISWDTVVHWHSTRLFLSQELFEHVPLLHNFLSESHEVLSGLRVASGHTELFPSQTTVSWHSEEIPHTFWTLAGVNVQLCSQQSPVLGEHTLPSDLLNVHGASGEFVTSEGVQQLSVYTQVNEVPQSHSSPGSTMLFPQDGVLLSARHQPLFTMTG